MTEPTTPRTTIDVLAEAGFLPIRAAARTTGMSVGYLRRAVADGRLRAHRTAADRRLLLLKADDVAALRDVAEVEREEVAA